MNRALRVVGKLLIVSVLFFLAYDKLRYPELYIKDYKHLTSQVSKYASYVGYSLPPADSHTIAIIRSSALFDGLIGCLLLLGNTRIYYVAFLRFFVGALVYYIPWDSKNIRTNLQKQLFGNTIGIVGVFLVLLSTRKQA